MPHLYEITQYLENMIEEEVDHETGEISPELEARIKAVEEDAKIIALEIVAYVKNLKAEQAAVVEEKKKLEGRARGIENRTDWLKKYLFTHLKEAGLQGERIADGRGVLTFSNTKVIEIDDEDLIPKHLFNEPTPPKPTPDKKRIKEMLEADKKVPGARIVKRGYVVIK